jgi:hypothetical protein
MVKYGRTECLSHPLCEILLQRKWDRYGLIMYGLTTFLYFIFLLSLTMIVVAHPSCIHDRYQEEYSTEAVDDAFNFNKRKNCQYLVENSFYVSLHQFDYFREERLLVNCL